MKKFILFTCSFLLGCVFCFAMPAPKMQRIEKKATIELAAFDHIVAYAFVGEVKMSDFKFEEAYRAGLYLNQSRQIKQGYSICYGTYSDTHTSGWLATHKYCSFSRSNC